MSRSAPPIYDSELGFYQALGIRWETGRRYRKLEREGLGDDRLQAAISQALVDETFTTLQPSRVAGRERDLRQPKAAQDDGPSQQLQGGHSRRLRTQGPADEDDAVGYPCLCAGPCCARAFLRSYSAIAG